MRIALISLARVDLLFADAPVGAADTDVLVAAAEAAADMALEVCQHEQRVVIEHALADVHLPEPFAALYGQRRNAPGVGDVHAAEGPAVDLQRFAVLLGGVAAALIVSVGLNDRRLRQTGGEQLLHPGAGEDVRPLGLAGVQLDGHAAAEHGADAVVDLFEAFFGELAREEHNGALTRTRLIRDVSVAVFAGNGLAHGVSSLASKRLRFVYLKYSGRAARLSRTEKGRETLPFYNTSIAVISPSGIFFPSARTSCAPYSSSFFTPPRTVS